MQNVAFFSNVETEEALQVVELCYGELLFEGLAQVCDQRLMRCCEGEVVDGDAEDDLLEVRAKLVKGIGVKGGNEFRCWQWCKR